MYVASSYTAVFDVANNPYMDSFQRCLWPGHRVKVLTKRVGIKQPLGRVGHITVTATDEGYCIRTQLLDVSQHPFIVWMA